MPDHFALLGEPRCPWIDPEALTTRFIALSAGAHPDAVDPTNVSAKSIATQRYVELNSAYICLRDPKKRLAHLLELETGNRPKDVHQIPADLAELFIEIANLCRQTDAFLAEGRNVTSPLLQVQFFERVQQQVGRLELLQSRLTSRREAVETELKEMNDVWPGPNPKTRVALLQRLEELYCLLSYFARWGNQIQERLLQLLLRT